MKISNILALMAVTVLFAAFSGTAMAGEGCAAYQQSVMTHATLVADSGYGSDESIGSGSMIDTETSEPALNSDSSGSVEQPAVESAPAPDSSLGTGTMDDSSKSFNLESPGGIDPRPGNDGP